MLAYNLLRTVMAVAANENDIEPRKVSFKGAKQALTAFAPKIEAARPEDRAALIDAMLTTIAYHRVGDRPGRGEPRARKRRPKPAARLTDPRHIDKLPHNRSKWFSWRKSELMAHEEQPIPQLTARLHSGWPQDLYREAVIFQSPGSRAPRRSRGRPRTLGRIPHKTRTPKAFHKKERAVECPV